MRTFSLVTLFLLALVGSTKQDLLQQDNDASELLAEEGEEVMLEKRSGLEDGLRGSGKVGVPEEEEEEERRGVRDEKKRKKMKKVCPGRCVKDASHCKSGRVTKSSDCEDFCCQPKQRLGTVIKKKEHEEEMQETKGDDAGKKKKCANRKLCDDVEGWCEPKNKNGCPTGQTTYLNKKGTKYCKGKCMCCAITKESECTDKKCSTKGGHCTTGTCEGKTKRSKSLCSGADCVCCLPPKPVKPCKTTEHCKHYKGTCVNMKTAKCGKEFLVGKKYCKGKGCGCCPEEEEEEAPEWGYEEKNGPATWPAKFPTCGGKRQSPIALVSSKAVGDFPFIPFKLVNYGHIPDSVTLTNNGHTAMVTLEQKEAPAIRGGDLEGEYIFLQYHFHWGKDKTEGSEHTIDGKSFPAELHLVHYKGSYGSVAEAAKHPNGIAVLGIMLEVTYKDNPALTPIIEGLAKIHEAKAKTEIKAFALQALIPSDVSKFFRYEGSLTTPTCDEIVIWTVFKDTITISHQQLAEFRLLMDEEENHLIRNFRPVQPLNDREVFMGRSRPYWSYMPPFDPPHWPKNFPTCGSDVRQSPVALVTKDAVGTYPRLTLGFHNYDVAPEKMTLLNNGHTAQAMATFKNDEQATIQGGDLKEKYVFLQFHAHWGSVDTQGSEHTIDGKKFPIEFHMVHYNAEYGSVAEAAKHEDGIAVLGIMAVVDKNDNQKLDPIIKALNSIHEPEEETEMHPFPLANLLPEDTDLFFRYKGSLTTPTCDEIVIWTVFRKSITISSKQLAEFRKLFDEGGMPLVNNFRQPQPLNGRMVYILSPDTHWSYVGETAPKFWKTLFPTCGGSRQSPINLVTGTAVTKSFEPFTFMDYDKVPKSMTIMNNGHTAQVSLDSTNVPMLSSGGLDGSGYTFLQFHFHWGANDNKGSEHTIDGKSYQAELHLVHWKKEYGSVEKAAAQPDGIAVLGIMLEVTASDNKNLQNIIDGLSKIRHAETSTTINPFPLKDLLPSNTKDFFRYEGSLTTPTCLEVVIWTVFKTPIQISHSQLEEFRKMEDESGLPLVDNFRPTQDATGRKVYMS